MSRLRRSDLLLLILSQRTSVSEGLLSWEIEFAAGRCNLPIVCAHTGRPPADEHGIDSARWPEALRHAVAGGHASAIHVPFQPRALARVFRRFGTSVLPAAKQA